MTARSGRPGNYTLTVTATNSSGKAVTVTPEAEGIVDSVDLTSTPPLLSIGGQSYTVDKIKRAIGATASGGGGSGSREHGHRRKQEHGRHHERSSLIGRASNGSFIHMRDALFCYF